MLKSALVSLNYSVHVDFVPPVDLFNCASLIIQQLSAALFYFFVQV